MSVSVNIQKKLGAFLLDVSFETEGNALGLLGASGSGKSVTLQCIAGILRPDAGRIVLNGRVLFDSAKRIDVPPQKRNIGFLFQQYALFPNMTVFRNILAGVRTGSRAEKEAVVRNALRTFRLEEVSRQYPHTLSGGQQQRVALARMLVGKPELLLLDEPFSALDADLKRRLALELSETLGRYRGDVLFVSHDRDEVRRFCPKVCVLDNGRSESVRPTEQLLLAPETVADARLAGYANIAKTERAASGDVRVPKWGLTFSPAAAVPDGAWICFPESAVQVFPDEQPGTIRVSFLEEVFESGRRLCLYTADGSDPLEPIAALCPQEPEKTKNRSFWLKIDEKAVIVLNDPTHADIDFPKFLHKKREDMI